MSDKEIIIEIVCRAFADNPRINAMIKKGEKERRIRIMAEYAYDLIRKLNGVYLSSDKSTVIFYYKKSEYKRDLVDILKYIRMFLLCIRPSQLLKTIKREKLIASQRPDIPDYIYVWILGSVPENKSLRGLADIRDRLWSTSEESKLPILIETTVEKVLKLYKYVGFEIYHEWYDEKAELNLWFLKRECREEVSEPVS
jgi:hypothetical protein